MTEHVDQKDVEKIVGATRRRYAHYARAVSAEQKVYLLHSKMCLDTTPDLRECEFSKALDRGIDERIWSKYEDRTIGVAVRSGELFPVWP
jgi:hypothetical protein